MEHSTLIQYPKHLPLVDWRLQLPNSLGYIYIYIYHGIVEEARDNSAVWLSFIGTHPHKVDMSAIEGSIVHVRRTPYVNASTQRNMSAFQVSSYVCGTSLIDRHPHEGDISTIQGFDASSSFFQLQDSHR